MGVCGGVFALVGGSVQFGVREELDRWAPSLFPEEACDVEEERGEKQLFSDDVDSHPLVLDVVLAVESGFGVIADELVDFLHGLFHVVIGAELEADEEGGRFFSFVTRGNEGLGREEDGVVFVIFFVVS